MRERNEQEMFWSGNFGDAYSQRNAKTAERLSSYTARWAIMLRHMSPLPKSALELGCNIGLNIMALNALCPSMDIEAVEINESAAKAAEETGAVIHQASLLDFKPVRTYELCFTCGVLIHMDPKVLPQVYDLLYASSSRYILIREYHNPVPVEVKYRDHQNKLFKRDFAGELLDRYSDLRLCDYGFFYRRDPIAPSDDTTFFVLEKGI